MRAPAGGANDPPSTVYMSTMPPPMCWFTWPVRVGRQRPTQSIKAAGAPKGRDCHTCQQGTGPSPPLVPENSAWCAAYRRCSERCSASSRARWPTAVSQWKSQLPGSSGTMLTE